MPRPSKVWKRKEDGFYYATINGKKEKLSEDYDEALELFHTLKATTKKRTGRLKCTLAEACDSFLDNAHKTKEAKTYENQRVYLQSFCDFVGKSRRVQDLTGAHFDDWSLACETWGQSTRSAARATVIACMNWCAKRAMIHENPLHGMTRGRYERRERILKPAEKEKIRAVVKGGMKDFLFCLEQTGCRPFSEAAKITAAMIDWTEGSVTLERHKNRKKGKKRVVYFPPMLLNRMRELANEHPEGPLFRTQKGCIWSRGAACKAMRRVEEKANVERLTVYAYRHTFITDCLAKSMSPTVVGELVGNSARTIARYYSHLDQHKDVLREAARKAVE